MLRPPSLRSLTLLGWFACGACAGQSGENAPRPAPTEVASPGELPSEPVGSEHPGDTPRGPLLVKPSASDLCTAQAQEDRVVLHHRDDARAVCVDFILVRLGQGGIAPEGLSLPWDWGVGHASSYPCTPAGELVSGERATTLSQITGSIGMGGGLTGLPASLMLQVSLSEPASAGAELPESYSVAGIVNVSATCEASAPWATQPLNLQVQPDPTPA